jgi:hypothetical protein
MAYGRLRPGLFDLGYALFLVYTNLPPHFLRRIPRGTTDLIRMINEYFERLIRQEIGAESDSDNDD